MKEIWFSQAASYDCNMNNKQAKEKGETILCLKREGQAGSLACARKGWCSHARKHVFDSSRVSRILCKRGLG
jgi:hypothetical protein